eukprot:TRINITY_DN29694_c0_g2_i1.p1 TRINITY_DN29694_c0_g2~~TRINITY_DN29694_c0_g2_i1.p1  ORF type:complete len:375 (+),score=76.61 TRINITY_DN29694_c0_g2_i1:56-1126(+)
MTFATARRATTLSGRDTLDGSDLGLLRMRAGLPATQPTSCAGLSRAEVDVAGQRRLLRSPGQAHKGFGAVSGTVGPEAECGGLPARRLRRSTLPDATARGAPGASRSADKILRRRDRHNDVQVTRVQADGDMQGRAFFDHAFQADRYATLLGRSDTSFDRFLATVQEEDDELILARDYTSRSSTPTTSHAQLPTLLGSLSRARAEGNGSEKETGAKELASCSFLDPGQHYSGEASLSKLAREVAQDSAQFGALLQAAQEALEEERYVGSMAAAQAQARVRQLNKQLDDLESRTKELTAAARAAAGELEPRQRKEARAAEAAEHEAIRKQQRESRRKGFNLVGRGPGWHTEPAQSQL